jgi:hypothetical protein
VFDCPTTYLRRIENHWWNSTMLSPFTIFVILIAVFAVIFVAMAVKSVPQGYE